MKSYKRKNIFFSKAIPHDFHFHKKYKKRKFGYKNIHHIPNSMPGPNPTAVTGSIGEGDMPMAKPSPLIAPVG